MNNNEFDNLEEITDYTEVVSQDTNNNTMQNSVNSFDKIKNTKQNIDKINDFRLNRINKNMNQNQSINQNSNLGNDLNKKNNSPNNKLNSNNKNNLFRKKKSNDVPSDLSVKNNYRNNEKNNTAFNDKINSSKVKSLFNKNQITGNNDTEKSNGLKKTVENKVTGKAVTAATGGLIQGKAAEKVGEIALKAQKKVIEKQKRKFKLIIGISVGIVIFLIFIILIVSGNVDDSRTISDTAGYITGNMSDEELVNYLSHISVCPNTRTLKEVYGDGDVIEIIKNHPDKLLSCQNAIDYYQAIQKEYKENTKACYRDRNENGEILDNFYRHDGSESTLSTNPKAITYFNGKHTIGYDDQVNSGYYDCQLNYPSQLLLETMSLGYTDSELFDENTLKSYKNMGIFDDYDVDFRKLSNALSEFVHEACFKWEIKYVDSKGVKHGSPCDGCTMEREKVAYDGYYFQTSFNKYVCYLKYGDTCEHPNYSGKPIERNEDMDYLEHECVGPNNDGLTSQMSSGNATACESIADDLEACSNRSDCEVKDGRCSSKEGTDNYDIDYGIVSGNGNDIVDFALQFVGNKYVWGGESLTNGADCSGFTMQVFKHFGVNLPHSSAAQRNYGQPVASLADAKPGDLLCFPGHVGIYMGNDKMVNAASAKSGIKVSDNVHNRTILTIRRLVG